MICSSILKGETKTFCVSPDTAKSKESYEIALKQIEKYKLKNEIIDVDNENYIIKFKNGSTINYLYPKEQSEIIRGKRSKIQHWLFDYEMINENLLDEILAPFIIDKEEVNDRKN